MRTGFYTFDDAGNVLSCGFMDAELFEHHATQVGQHIASAEDADLMNELRLYHHRYKVVDGQLALRDRDEIDAIEKARLPQPADGPSEMQQMLDKQDAILQELKTLPGKMAESMKELWK